MKYRILRILFQRDLIFNNSWWGRNWILYKIFTSFISSFTLSIHWSSLHGPHLVPLPVLLRLPGQTTWENDSGHLEQRHHGQTAGDGRDTVEQQHVEAAGGHLSGKVVCSGGTWAGYYGHVASTLLQTTHWRNIIWKVKVTSDSTTLKILHNLIPDNSHTIGWTCKDESMWIITN